MAENSKIEWTTHTFNPWIGCTKVSDGCKHCYAEAMMDKRYGRVQWGPSGARVRTSAANWKTPLTWNRKAAAEGKRARVFCASLADVFEDKPDQPEMDDWRAALMQLIQDTPNLDWLLLTKRPENVMRLFSTAWQRFGGQTVTALPPNVWIGTSVENQEQADKRVPELLKIRATVRFLSMEPLLGPVDLCRHMDYAIERNEWGLTNDGYAAEFDWVIVGGESSPNARPMHPDWARSIRDQCQTASVPFFFKQWGEWVPYDSVDRDDLGHRYADSDDRWQWLRPDGYEGAEWRGTTTMLRVGKHAAGRLLDGREWNEFPEAQS